MKNSISKHILFLACFLGLESITIIREMQIKTTMRAFLEVQWLRICLPMQGTRVRALVWEDPTCRGATSPVSHNY